MPIARLALLLAAAAALAAQPAGAAKRAVGAGAAFGAGELGARDKLQRALDYRMAHVERFRKDLLALARFPSVSALPKHELDVAAAAEWLRDKLFHIGMQHTKVMQVDGELHHPIVYSHERSAGKDKPTILIYGHYDVQPADPLDAWETPPFEPQIRDGYFYGRGVDDDKGGILNAIHAVESFINEEGGNGLPVNVQFLLEGSEEIGSPHLAEFLKRHPDKFFDVDLAISADGGQISEWQAAISTGLRGAVALQVDVRTAHTDMHSGVKGGSVQNANHALVQLLATLRDPETGKILVEGFYDGVEEPTAEDKADMEKYPLDEEAEKATLGILGYTGEEGRSTLERRWHRPTLEIVGMGGGFQGEGIKTIVPAAASAKLSARLVPGQAPADITKKIKQHLRKHVPPLTNVTIKVLGFRADPWTSPRGTPGNAAAARVLREVMGEPLYTRDGGTIPALAYFQEILRLRTTVFSFSLGERIHAPNERFKVSMFDKGSEAWIRLLADLGKTGKAALSSGLGPKAEPPPPHEEL